MVSKNKLRTDWVDLLRVWASWG